MDRLGVGAEGGGKSEPAELDEQAEESKLPYLIKYIYISNHIYLLIKD